MFPANSHTLMRLIVDKTNIDAKQRIDTDIILSAKYHVLSAERYYSS